MAATPRQPSQWAAIAGRWHFTNGEVTYLGPEEGSPFGIALTDVRLRGGIVEVLVSLSTGADAGRVLLGYQSLTTKYVSVGLGGYDRAYVISEFDPSFGWRGVDLAGSRSNLESDRPYSMQVRVAGQRITLEVDGIRVLGHVLSEPLSGDQVGLFAWGTSPIIFRNLRIAGELPKAFVVMQFSEPYTHLYDEVVQPVAKEMNLEAYRVSEVYVPGIIVQDIIQGIAEAKVVIAEITPPNRNVFYELGYAHALRKPTILLAERGKELPFDISGYRVIFYDNTIRGKKVVEEDLRRHLTAILRD